MKQKVPNGVVIAAIVILIAGVAYFGYRIVTGVNGPDMTQENIKRYQAARDQAAAHKFTSPQDAARAGAPMGAAPMGANPGGAAGGSH